MGHARIVQAEGHEHRAPVGVIRAVPVAVAGVTLRIVRFIDDEVAVALPVAQLGVRDGQHVLPPVAAQMCSRKRGLPLGAALPIVPGDPGLRAAGGLAAQRILDARREIRRAVDRRRPDGRAARILQHNRLLRKHLAAALHRNLHAVGRETAADEDARADFVALEGPGSVGLHDRAQLRKLLRQGGGFGCGFRRGF